MRVYRYRVLGREAAGTEPVERGACSLRSECTLRHVRASPISEYAEYWSRRQRQRLEENSGDRRDVAVPMVR